MKTKCIYCNRKIRESNLQQILQQSHTVCLNRHKHFNYIMETQRDWDKYILELRRENSQQYLND